RLDGYWRFKERHKLRLMYFDSKRHDTRVVDEDIQFRDTVFPVNVQVDTSFDTRIGELAYEYAFLRRERYELTGTIGIHNLRFGLDLKTTGGPSGGGVARGESANADGPLPVIGLRYIWRMADKVSLDAQAQFFKIKVDPYDGRLEDYTASVVWMPFEHVGF